MLNPLFVAALAVSTVLGRSPGDAAQACLPQDARGTALLESAKGHVTDPSSTSFRAVTMKVPVVTENDVQFVSDESVCRSALQAYAAVVPADPGTSFSAVYVIRTGTYYVVAEPTQRAGEWMRAIAVDGTYAKKSGIFGLLETRTDGLFNPTQSRARHPLGAGLVRVACSAGGSGEVPNQAGDYLMIP